MKTPLRDVLVSVGLLVGMIAGVPLVSAQSFSFPAGGFTTTNVCANSSNPAAGCQVLTNGSPSRPQVVSGGILRLTTANMNQHGSAWFNVQQPLSTGFTTAFQFKISSTNSCRNCTFPADGLAIVIQNDPAGTGALGYTGDGQNITYGNDDFSSAHGPGRAIENSLAIELDTHQNINYGDPDGNHIAVQSCGPNNATTLTPNSADHTYICPNGSPAKLALQSLPTGLSLSDGNTHTITVNYLPPGSCTSSCNNLSVYMDSTLILQATLNITTQLNLSASGGAYLGFTAATGSDVQNNDLVSWSFSSLPLAPITINQPLQPTTPTNFNYTGTLSAVADYSQSGLPPSDFLGVVMQGTVQTITDDGPGSQYYNLVNSTPFQGTSCEHQDVGTGNYVCVATTDLCTTPTNQVPSGANCPNTGTQALIGVSNTYNLDPTQKQNLTNPGYIMGTDDALNCPPDDNNSCKMLVNIFTSISGDITTTKGNGNQFNSTLYPIYGLVEPDTSVSTTPTLNSGWTNGAVTVNFNSIDKVPSNNSNPPSTLPSVTSIAYSVTGADVPNPASGTISGSTGSISIPGAVQGTTVVTYAATDNAGTVENDTTYNPANNTLSTTSPTFTINVDLTFPTVSPVTISPPSPTYSPTQTVTASYSCAESVSGVVYCGPPGSGSIGPIVGSTGTLTSTVPNTGGTHTVTITAQSLAGNQSTGSVTYTVAQATPTVTFTGAPASAAYQSSFTVASTTNASTTAVISATGACSVSGTTVTMTSGTGTCSLTANWAADNNYLAASATQSTTAAKIAPTVTFTGAPASAAYQSGFTVATTTNASTTAVISATGACSNVGNSITMTSGTGTCSLAATWAADNNYLAASATQSTTATKIAPTVTFTGAPASAAYQSSFTVATTTNASTTAVIGASGACSNVGNSITMTSGTGTCSLAANWAADNNYLAASATQSTTAALAAPTVTFTGAPASAAYQSSFTVASTTNASTTAVISSSGACSNSGSSVSMTSGTGTCSLTATWAADANYSPATASQSTNATQIAPTVTFTGAPASAAYQSSFAVMATTNASTTAVISATGACSNVGSSITMISGTGTCSLTANWAADANYTTATAGQSTIAAKIAPTVTFTGAPASAAYQSGFTVATTTNASTAAVIGASGACSNVGNSVTMTSGTGTCSLAANWAADANYTTASATQSTAAARIAPTVTFTGAPASAAYQSSFTVATTTNASTTAVISASGACSNVGNSITMTSGTGTCSLTANWAADNNYQAATASQSTTAGKIAPTVTFTGAPASAVYGASFAVATTTNASTTAVIGASGACSNVGNSITMTSGTGTCSLAANWAADANYNAATASQSTAATLATSTISWATPSPIVYGTPLSSVQLDATANVAGTFAYTPPAGTVLAAGNQTLSVMFTPTYTADYTTASAQVMLLVTQPQISLSLSSINFGNVPFGQTVSQTETISNVGNGLLNITGVSIKCGSSCDGDDFSFKSSCGSSLAAGASCSIVVHFCADDLGTRNATLIITDNAPGSPQSVPLTGTVVKNKW
ncbi:MAG: choice-of-anchor D domain-containing protein [Terriglobales bacterium]